jgi:hypothetical protein
MDLGSGWMAGSLELGSLTAPPAHGSSPSSVSVSVS